MGGMLVGIALCLCANIGSLVLGKAPSPTPPLGWDSYVAVGCAVDDALIRDTVDSVVQHLRPAGYDTVILSDCVFPRGSRNPSTGVLVPDAGRFPSGIASLVNYAHSKGLRFGIGTDVGEATCAGYEGSMGREKLDAATFALWGVDFVTATLCGAPISRAESLFTAMSDALRLVGPSIVFMVNAPATSAWRWAPHIANAWFVGSFADVPGGPGWSDVLRNIDEDGLHSAVAGPGGWNYPGALGAGSSKLTQDEWRSQIALWAVSAAPLIIGVDVRNAASKVAVDLSNPDVVQIDQDPLGSQGMRVYDDGKGHQVWAKRLTVARKTDRSVACALFNRGDSAAAVTVTWDEIGLASGSPAAVRDLWAQSEIGTYHGSITARVNAHGVAFYFITQSMC